MSDNQLANSSRFEPCPTTCSFNYQ